MKQAFDKYKYQFSLLLILSLAAILRFKAITFQSLWLDELHTMVQCDPQWSWKQLFDYLTCCDSNPPLYYIIEKILFSVFGYTEFVARISSALVGSLGVWCMYLLGKELLNQRLGLIMALLTSVNYFHLYYSQEARVYIFAFLFSILSFLFLIRLTKQWKFSSVLWYSIFTLALLYSHYYGILIFISQIIIVGILHFREQMNKQVSLQRYLPIIFLILLGYTPWLRFFLERSAAQSFWIEPISPGFAIQYFFGFFGNSDLVKPLLMLLVVYCLFQMFSRSYEWAGILIIVWIFTVYFVSYIYSVAVIPILHPRYTIVVLPAFIALVSFGFEFIRHRYLRYILLCIFCLLSLTDIILVKKYYSTVQKTQFRELTDFVVSNNSRAYPIINELTEWHQSYYLKKLRSKARVITGNKESIADSIIQQKKDYGFDAFWIVGAHGDKKPSETKKEELNSSGYILVNEKDFYDAWAQFYVSINSQNDHLKTFNYKNFSKNAFELDRENVIALWDNSPVKDSVNLFQGKWELMVISKGSPVSGIFPLINVYINNEKVAEYYTTNSYKEIKANFTLAESEKKCLMLEMVNDSLNPTNQADRNAFIRNIVLRKLN